MPDDLPNETFDAADPAAIDNASRDAARIVREDAEVLRSVMQTRQGRSWLCRLMSISGETSFNPGCPDVTAFNLGAEYFGKKLMAAAQDASFELYVMGLKEAREEEKRQEELRRREQRNREERENPIDVTKLVNDLPPPPGFR